ncbi:MAG: hypothetical protein GC162_01865 [Planctomycetes bacterium]|nr:hypothetical protein [Planctomycetota bacterium]
MDPVDRKRLADLLESIEDIDRVWSDADLADIFAHLLATCISSLHPDLGSDLSSSDDTRTISTLLTESDPNLAYLQLLKNFAKANRIEHSDFLPKEVATGVYYLAIAAAIVRCGDRISLLDDDQLAEGLVWLRRQPWIDDAWRRHIQSLLAMMNRSV